MAVIGGSISAGQGAGGLTNAYVSRMSDWLRDTFPQRPETVNGAFPGAPSSYMSLCVQVLAAPHPMHDAPAQLGTKVHHWPPISSALHPLPLAPLPLPSPCLAAEPTHRWNGCLQEHIPRAAQIVFVEYAVNDDDLASIGPKSAWGTSPPKRCALPTLPSRLGAGCGQAMRQCSE